MFLNESSPHFVVHNIFYLIGYYRYNNPTISLIWLMDMVNQDLIEVNDWKKIIHDMDERREVVMATKTLGK